MLTPDTSLNESAYQLETTAGESIILNSAGKTTVYYFFAPWCQVCHASIGNLQALHLKNSHINVVAIALDYVDQQQVLDFTNQHQLSFPVAYGSEQMKQEFKIKGYPSYYVVSEDNTVKYRSIGYSSELGLYLRTL